MSNCFKGDFKVTTQSLMGKAELKKLHSMLIGEFPLLSKKMIEKVLSSKEDINILKCSNGTALYVSGEGNPPAFFDDGFGGVYPTLFTLWRLGNFMPTLVTHPQVSKFVLPKESQRSAGADMMLPGVIVPDEGLGPLHEGQKRAICVEGNDAVVGVGKMVVSDSDIKQKGMKGKGMEVRHVYLDSLWKYGGRKVPNDGFHADEVVAAEGNSIMAPAAADEEEAEEEEEEEAEEAGGGDAAVEEMEPDVLMAYCFYAAFKTTCTDSALPITVDKFYSEHMQGARPKGHPPLDAKKTQWKQVGPGASRRNSSAIRRDVQSHTAQLLLTGGQVHQDDAQVEGVRHQGEQEHRLDRLRRPRRRRVPRVRAQGDAVGAVVEHGRGRRGRRPAAGGGRREEGRRGGDGAAAEPPAADHPNVATQLVHQAALRGGRPQGQVRVLLEGGRPYRPRHLHCQPPERGRGDGRRRRRRRRRRGRQLGG